MLQNSDKQDEFIRSRPRPKPRSKMFDRTANGSDSTKDEIFKELSKQFTSSGGANPATFSNNNTLNWDTDRSWRKVGGFDFGEKYTESGKPKACNKFTNSRALSFKDREKMDLSDDPNSTEKHKLISCSPWNQKEDYLTVQMFGDDNIDEIVSDRTSDSIVSRDDEKNTENSPITVRDEQLPDVKKMKERIERKGQSFFEKMKATANNIIKVPPTGSKGKKLNRENMTKDKTDNNEESSPDEKLKKKKKAHTDESSQSSSTKKSKPHDRSQKSRTKTEKEHKTRSMKSKSMNYGKFLGVTIHGIDVLPMHPSIIHPVVKVTVMTQGGSFIAKSHQDLKSVASGHYEQNRRHRKTRHGNEHHEDHNTLLIQPTSDMKDAIPSIMTQPYDVCKTLPLFSPNWNELVVFEEPYIKFVTEQADPGCAPIIFFEVLDFLPLQEIKKKPFSVRKSNPANVGWHKIGWAFLKLIGSTGDIYVDRTLRLQLYKPVKTNVPNNSQEPEIFHWWKKGKRIKMSSALSVRITGTVKSSSELRDHIQSNASEDPDISQEGQTHQDEKLEKPNQINVNEEESNVGNNWLRLQGQPCKVPNKFLRSLPSSQSTLNYTAINGNCFCVKFSPCGQFAVAGLDTNQIHAVIILHVCSGNILKCLKEHHGLIYDVQWSPLCVDRDLNPYYLVASSSADSTVIIWSLQLKRTSRQLKSTNIFKILSHPSYAYCSSFLSTSPCILATGCFDGLIRLWKCSQNENEATSSKFEEGCSSLMDFHESFVNCVVTSVVSKIAFSGDGHGNLAKWDLASPQDRWQLHSHINLSERGKHPVNSLQIHPNGKRILIHFRNSCIKIVDIDSLTVIHILSGLINDKMNVRSCFSPCGNLVLSGSENCSLNIWDADTGDMLSLIQPEHRTSCIVTSVDYHPFDYYVALGVASKISEPSPIIFYTYEPPHLTRTWDTTMRAELRQLESHPKSHAVPQLKPNEKKSHHDTVIKSDSREKFVNIIKKLDAALTFSRDNRGYKQAGGLSKLSDIVMHTSAHGKSTIDSEQQTSVVNTHPISKVTSKATEPDPTLTSDFQEMQQEGCRTRPVTPTFTSYPPYSPLKDINLTSVSKPETPQTPGPSKIPVRSKPKFNSK